MSEWLPIESAPKDGTRILAYGKIAISDWPIGIVRWHGLWDADNDPDQGPWDSYPTHWMPLPEAPKS